MKVVVEKADGGLVEYNHPDYILEVSANNNGDLNITRTHFNMYYQQFVGAIAAGTWNNAYMEYSDE